MENSILVTKPAAFFHELAEFRSRRLDLISSDLSPIELERGAKVLLHVVPRSAFDRSTSVDLESLDRPLMPLFSGASNVRFNFDGQLTYSDGNDGVRSYVQVFHTGAVEAVYVFAERNDKKIIRGNSLRSNLIEATTSYLKKQQTLKVDLPVAVMLAFSGVKGYRLAVADDYEVYDRHPIDRDDLLMPEVLIVAFESDVSQAMRPLFNRFWNAAGLARCFQYDKAANA